MDSPSREPEAAVEDEDPVTVVFQPTGRRARVHRGISLLSAARRAGVGIESTCGGVGTCGECVVRVVSGSVSPSDDDEDSWLLREDRDQGLRIACLTRALDRTADIVVEVPEHSRIDVHPSQTESAVLAHAAESTSSDASARGVALDLGTTGLAAYLVDLSTGQVLSAVGAPNPQVAFGEDVMSRLAIALREPESIALMRRVLTDALSGLIVQLCREGGCRTFDVTDVEVVGNTAMHHLFFGLPIESLAWAPYVPADLAARTTPAATVGLHVVGAAPLHSAPVIAGFVGSDHVAMLLASDVTIADPPTLLLDVGTNTEISLIAKGRHLCCSAASGPAFEGAHIREGMRAAPGAIDRVQLVGDRLEVGTLDDLPAVGICGSGLLDAVAALREVGALTEIGGWVAGSPSLVGSGRKAAARLCFPSEEHCVSISRQDVGEIQLAKAAIRAGIKLLTEAAGINEADIERIVLAGAFGTHLRASSAIAIGLLPVGHPARIDQVGNAAGAGACRMLANPERRSEASALIARIEYVELTGDSRFTDRFTQALALTGDPWEDEDRRAP